MRRFDRLVEERKRGGEVGRVVAVSRGRRAQTSHSEPSRRHDVAHSAETTASSAAATTAPNCCAGTVIANGGPATDIFNAS